MINKSKPLLTFFHSANIYWVHITICFVRGSENTVNQTKLCSMVLIVIKESSKLNTWKCHVLWTLVRRKRAQQGKVQKVTPRRSKEGDILRGRVKENLSDKVTFEHNLKWGQGSTRGLEKSKYKGPEVVLAPFQRKNKLCKSLMIVNSISVSY